MAREEKISLDGLNRADVLAVLYNSSKPQGMGFMQYDPTPMTREEAQSFLDAGQTFFDYLKGRVMKIDLSGDELDPWGYDRDNGSGSVEHAISALRSTNETNPGTVKAAHHFNTQISAEEVRNNLGEESSCEDNGGMKTYHMGLDDVAHILGPKVDESIKRLDDLGE